MIKLNDILFDEKDTLRSGWRAAIFLFAFTFVSVVLGTTALIILGAAGIGGREYSSVYLVVNAVLSLIPAIVIGWVCGKWLENLPLSALGASFTRGWLRHFFAGCIVGTAALSLAVLIAFVFGGERFVLNVEAGTSGVAASLAISFLIFAVAAAFEEALFRGYILQTFERSGLAWLAVLLTSVFFGAVHLNNPNAGLISSINTFLAGILFSVAYFKTRDLWFVWGVHLMWNFAQGSIFGIEVSGLTDITKNPLLKEIDTGPTWLTGQTYGLEGGLACTLALIVATIGIYYFPVKDGRVNHIGI